MAVYTDVTDADLTRFMADYDLGGVVACKGIAEGVENSNFLLKTETGTFILTLYEKRVNAKDLPFFLSLMDHLALRGFRCPTPVHARDGEALRELCGKPAALITFLEGLWPRHIEPFHCKGVGAVLADLHRLTADFAMRRPNALSTKGWRELFGKVADRADEVAPGLALEIEADLVELEARWPEDLPVGVIHADLFPDNVFFYGAELSGVIDFYFACTDSLSYDLAICLNAWCFDAGHRLDRVRSAELLSAYQSRRPLNAAEIAALPLLARGSALRFLLTRLHDWLFPQGGALVRPKDPQEYLAKLRFHRAVRGAEAYGL